MRDTTCCNNYYSNTNIFIYIAPFPNSCQIVFNMQSQSRPNSFFKLFPLNNSGEDKYPLRGQKLWADPA